MVGKGQRPVTVIHPEGSDGSKRANPKPGDLGRMQQEGAPERGLTSEEGLLNRRSLEEHRTQQGSRSEHLAVPPASFPLCLPGRQS